MREKEFILDLCCGYYPSHQGGHGGESSSSWGSWNPSLSHISAKQKAENRQEVGPDWKASKSTHSSPLLPSPKASTAFFFFPTALSVRGQVFKYVSLWGTFCIQNSTIISQEVSPPPPPHPPKLELTRQHGFDQTVLTGQPLLSWHQALYEAWGTRTYEARPTLGISHSSPAR